MRQYFVILGLFLLFLTPADIASARPPKLIDTQETHVGEILFFKLPGDPSAGYKWRLNEGLSTGLHLVDVDQIGWLLAEKGKSMFFKKRSALNIAVRTMAAGEAILAFDYYRRIGGRTFTKTSLIRIYIKPRLASQ
jgi:hypothetical protein